MSGYRIRECAGVVRYVCGHDLGEVSPQVPDALVLNHRTGAAVGDVAAMQHKVVWQDGVVGGLLLHHRKAQRDEGALVCHEGNAGGPRHGRWRA